MIITSLHRTVFLSLVFFPFFFSSPLGFHSWLTCVHITWASHGVDHALFFPPQDEAAFLDPVQRKQEQGNYLSPSRICLACTSVSGLPMVNCIRWLNFLPNLDFPEKSNSRIVWRHGMSERTSRPKKSMWWSESSKSELLEASKPPFESVVRKSTPSASLALSVGTVLPGTTLATTRIRQVLNQVRPLTNVVGQTPRC